MGSEDRPLAFSLQPMACRAAAPGEKRKGGNGAAPHYNSLEGLIIYNKIRLVRLKIHNIYIVHQLHLNNTYIV